MSSIGKNQNIQKWNDWKGNMTDQQYVQMVHDNKLSRKVIAEACGFSKSALRQNPTIAKELAELENDLRNRLILPPFTPKGEDESRTPKAIQKESIKAAREQSRVPELEQRILELEAENKALKGKLGRFSELSDVFMDMEELE